MAGIKNRIIKFKDVSPEDLVDHPGQWRLHQDEQRSALQSILEEVGLVGVILTRPLEDGKLQIIDGHLRRELLTKSGNKKVKVAVTDLSEQEANLILATFDPIGAMADMDSGAFDELVINTEAQADEVQRLLSEIAGHPVEIPDLTDGFKTFDSERGTDLADTMFSLGQYRFPVDREVYLKWQEDIRQRVGFGDAEVVAEIRKRLGV